MHQDAGRPPLPETAKARLLDLPDRVTTTLSGITTANFAELFVDGLSLGRKAVEISEDSVEPLVWDLPKRESNNCTGAVSFPINVSGLQCHGLNKASAASAELCAQECCKDSTCNTWQLDQGSSHRGCWIGDVSLKSCQVSNHSEDHWVGGQRSLPPVFSNATLLGVVSMKPDAKVVAAHTILAPIDGAVKLKMFLDVPSEATGTGKTLLLDGTDIALIRVQVSDARGVLVSNGITRISFRVLSGPGRVIGVGNGDPQNLEWMKSSSINVFGGLARVFVAVTQDCVSPNLATVQEIDLDASRYVKIYPHPHECTTASILVEAAASGLTKATISIPVSVDTLDAPLAVAKRTTPMFKDGFSYMASFDG
eukprot:TRINITY_DN1867_c0_g1_i1.p1 TRINITY_DN1867_c0_g1~~TRINITY_DN1867_c0_g1_i1.p1  ORF type:complete len:367 (-),score=63.28 TRINITY_DN1867_c0_g1_i1:111-1211(-)